MSHDINNDENVEMENGVLGAIILSEQLFEIIEHDLQPELFTHPQNRIVCEAIKQLYHQRIKVDILTTTQQLHRMGQLEASGGSFYVSSLTNRIAGWNNLEIHVRFLQQMFLVREVKRIAQLGLYMSSEHKADGFEIIEKMLTQFEKVQTQLTANKAFATIQTVSSLFMQQMMDKQAGIFPPSIKTGLTTLDELGGFFNSDLIIMAGRPGMGKTALMVRLIRNAVISLKESVGCFSLEMSNLQLLTRIASAECEIDSEDLRVGNVSHSQMNELQKKVVEWRSLKLYMDDTASIDIDELMFKARKMKREHGIKILFIDYLQLITSKKHTDTQKIVSYVSGMLKKLAKELDIPVIALSQLSRKLEERKPEDRMPILSDLRESGAIEQDADQIYFIFRPEYYDMKTFFVNGQEMFMKGKALLKCAKNRHGKLFIGLFRFISRFTDFRDDTDQLQISMPSEAPKNFYEVEKETDKDDLPF